MSFTSYSRRHALVGGFSIALAFLGFACAPPSPTAGPTVQEIATQIAPTVQGAATQIAPTVQGAATQIAPTVQGAATQMAPTVQAAATQVPATAQAAGTAMIVERQATATAVAPTAQAVATIVAPTVQAVATQAVSAVSTSVTTSQVQIVNVHLDPSDSSVGVQNSGDSAMNLRNWTLLMGPRLAVTLGDIPVEAHQTRIIHFSPGVDTPTDVYLGLGSAAMSGTLDPNQKVVLVMPSDQVASIYTIS